MHRIARTCAAIGASFSLLLCYGCNGNRSITRRVYNIPEMSMKYWCIANIESTTIRSAPGSYGDLSPLLEVLLHCRAVRFEFPKGSKFKASVDIGFFDSEAEYKRFESPVLLIEYWPERAIRVFDRSSGDSYMCRPDHEANNRIRTLIDSIVKRREQTGK